MPKGFQVFNGMAYFYRCFIKNFAFINGPITKLLCKTKVFAWTIECQETREAIKLRYLDAPILVAPKWDMEFHVHTNVLNLAVVAMLVQNPTGKCDYLIAYASILLNNVEKNYTTTGREALAMVYALHKFKHCLLGSKFFFCQPHGIAIPC